MSALVASCAHGSGTPPLRAPAKEHVDFFSEAALQAPLGSAEAMFRFFQDRYPGLGHMRGVCDARDYNVRGCLGRRTRAGTLRIEVWENAGQPHVCMWLYRPREDLLPRPAEVHQFEDRWVRYEAGPGHQVCMHPADPTEETPHSSAAETCSL